MIIQQMLNLTDEEDDHRGRLIIGEIIGDVDT